MQVRADGSRAAKDECWAAGLGPRDREAGQLAAVIVLTKSRRPSCKSSGGSRRLGAWAFEDGDDTCRGSKDRCTVSGFGPQKPRKNSSRNRDGVPEEVGGQVVGLRSLRRDKAKS
jgi:hypothetical protein